MSIDAIWDLVSAGSYHDPHALLGVHPSDGRDQHPQHVVVRALRPFASCVDAELDTGEIIPLTHRYEGIWEGRFDARPRGTYTLRARYSDSSENVRIDPYQFEPTIGADDLAAFDSGHHEQLWRVLGAHARTIANIDGVAFTVWAPHARAVRIIGDLNGWNGRLDAMRSMGSSGVWEIFLPNAKPGVLYKYEILTAAGTWIQKIDPMAQLAETPPRTASVVTASDYRWSDGEWLAARSSTDPHSGRISVYELHLGSWRPGLNYRSVADPLIDYVQKLGFTHVEFLPLAEHPFGGSWGYQVTGYYAPTSRYGNPDDLRYLIDRLHDAGIGVIMDWVPGHFPKDEWGLARFDGEPLYEHADPRRGEHPDWGTFIFDYGNPRVRNFLVANALYWFEEFHVDGLRVDAVASMLYLDYSRGPGQWEPNVFGGNENLEARAFLQDVTTRAYRRNPGILMIAEESTSYPGVTALTSHNGLGFGFKWNMGWMNDTLRYIEQDPMWRSDHHGLLTLPLTYAWSEHYILPISHDEVVHGKGSLYEKMPGDRDKKLANLRAFLALMWAHPGKQLLFMGQEFGQPSEWNESSGVDWAASTWSGHEDLLILVSALNRVQRDYSALWEGDNDSSRFTWLDGSDAAGNTISFLRRNSNGNEIAVIINFSGVTHEGYRMALPRAGRWGEIVNTDARMFGGKGTGNYGSILAENSPWLGQPASAVLTVPALSALFLTPLGDTDAQ